MRADTEYLTTKELTERWKYSAWSISQWAKQGRIEGAEKSGGRWRFLPTARLLDAAPTEHRAVLDELADAFAAAERQIAKLR